MNGMAEHYSLNVLQPTTLCIWIFISHLHYDSHYRACIEFVSYSNYIYTKVTKKKYKTLPDLQPSHDMGRTSHRVASRPHSQGLYHETQLINIPQNQEGTANQETILSFTLCSETQETISQQEVLSDASSLSPPPSATEAIRISTVYTCISGISSQIARKQEQGHNCQPSTTIQSLRLTNQQPLLLLCLQQQDTFYW